MPPLSKHTVLEELTTGLAARRRQTRALRAAYLALARAILAEPGEQAQGSGWPPPGRRSVMQAVAVQAAA